MINIKNLRENKESLKENIKKRKSCSVDIDKLYLLDEGIRENKKQMEILLHDKKTISKKIGEIKKKGQSAQQLQQESKKIDIEIKQIKEDMQNKEDIFLKEWLLVPNIIDDDVPLGESEKENIEIKRWGKIPDFDFKVKTHWELGEKLNILDFKTAAKLSGPRFAVYKRYGAQLERALINFMIDVHTKKYNYTEIIPPFLVNEEIMVGTGQLPKFKEEAYEIDGQYLIPTAEVPLINLHRNEILKEEELPLKYVAWSTCFRKEAGSYGKDVRGIMRQHQFNKIELVQFTKPEDSSKVLEKITEDAQEILRLLKIPYRIVVLCSGDIGFSSAKTYDIEVWLPGENKFREVSSCSNCLDFQARRANIRFKRKGSKKTEYVHTLNGSGLAVGRTLIAILENYQQKDGSVIIPKVLQDYMKTKIVKAE
ncbi:MAG: serine--tRNA ligase [Deltaproteobacteria bacterium]|nr:serine--tRNA ligase [Deltaproteobacteria bacterium]